MSVPRLSPGNPASSRNHLAQASAPLPLHLLQCPAAGHLGREPYTSRAHFLYYWYWLWGLSFAGVGGLWDLRFGEENRQTLHLLSAGGLRIPFPRDCGEELKNGPSASKTTTIFLNGNRERPLDVFCYMETDGGGWLVGSIQSPAPCLSLCSTGDDAGEPQADFGLDCFPGVPAPHGWTDGLLERLGGVRPWFWEHFRGILAGSVLHRAGEPGKGWQSSEPQYPDEACSTPDNEALHSLTQAGDYSLHVDLRAGKEAVFAQYDFFRVDSAKENYRLHLEGYHGTAGKCGHRWGVSRWA